MFDSIAVRGSCNVKCVDIRHYRYPEAGKCKFNSGNVVDGFLVSQGLREPTKALAIFQQEFKRTGFQ